jgi:uncharacterized membrane protein YbhN (UPF0104 family)
VGRIVDAAQVFFGHLASVELKPLGLAIACHVVKLACTSRAWRNVIAAAYPETRVRGRSILGAYAAGVGVNAVVPARGGDVVRLYLAHRAVPGSTYTTLASTFLVMSIVDSTVALSLLGYALTLGLLPSLDLLPDLPSFDFAWFFRHPRASLALLAALVALGILAYLRGRRRVREFRERVAQAFTILRTPLLYLRAVAFWQFCDWGLRLATIWFFLGAFGIDQSIRNVLLVQVTHSLSTLAPVTPGGVGTEQAFIVFVFRDIAAKTAVLAFSIGMKLTLTGVNVVVGFTAIALALRTFRFRRAMAGKPGAPPEAAPP